MIRVLHVYKDYFPVLGGIENHIRFLCAELAKDGNFQVRVLVTNQNLKTVIEKYDNLEIIKVGRQAKFASTPISFGFLSWAARLKTDILHLHFPFPLGEVPYLFLKPHKKMVITYHSDIIRQKALGLLYKPLLGRILRSADAIIAASPAYARSSKYLVQYCSKCRIIPYFAETQHFQSRDQTKIKQIKDKYGSPLVLFVGHFRYYKGLEYLICAAEKVDSKFLFIGDGYLEKKLKQLVRAKQLEDKIRFASGVSDADLPSYYHASDVFVLPSIQRSEAFGIVLLEAMSCGIPVISTELKTGTSWVNLDNQTGLVVPPRNPVALSDAINYLLAHKDKCLEFGKAGMERVKNQFSKEIAVKEIKNLYYQLTSS